MFSPPQAKHNRVTLVHCYITTLLHCSPHHNRVTLLHCYITTMLYCYIATLLSPPQAKHYQHTVATLPLSSMSQSLKPLLKSEAHQNAWFSLVIMFSWDTLKMCSKAIEWRRAIKRWNEQIRGWQAGLVGFAQLSILCLPACSWPKYTVSSSTFNFQSKRLKGWLGLPVCPYY